MQAIERPLLIVEAAAYMRVSRNTITRWIQRGWLEAIGAGHTTRIPLENLQAMKRPARRKAG
jgi:excisionase family DNA binding protein